MIEARVVELWSRWLMRNVKFVRVNAEMDVRRFLWLHY